MMEQTLINELIKLMCKGGCETFVGNFQKDPVMLTPQPPWSEREIEEAVHYVRYMNEFFGKQEAVAVITSLVAKFHISLNDLTIPKTSAEKVGLEN